jgi:hypothetical protein
MRWITQSRLRRAHRQKFRSVHFCLFQQHRPKPVIGRTIFVVTHNTGYRDSLNLFDGVSTGGFP